MYRLPVFIFAIVVAISVVDLSESILRRDTDYHAQFIENLQRARIELIPVPYPERLNPPSTTPLPKPYGHVLFHLYHMHPLNGDQAAWHHNEYPQQYSYSYVYKKNPPSLSCAHPPCLVTDNLQAQINANRYQQTQQANQYQQVKPAYSGYHATQQAHNPYQYNTHQQVQPAYNGYHATQQSHNPYQHNTHQQVQPAYNGYDATQQSHNLYQHNTHQQVQPAYNGYHATQQSHNFYQHNTHQQVQPAYNGYDATQQSHNLYQHNTHQQVQPAYNGYHASQQSHNPYQHTTYQKVPPAYNPDQQVQPTYNGYQGTQPPYNPNRQSQPADHPYQQSQPVAHLKPTETPTHASQTTTPVYNKIATRIQPYQYHHDKQRIPPPGPLSKPDSEEVFPAVDEITPLSGIEQQQPSLAILNTSTQYPTPQFSHQVSTTDSTTHRETVTEYAEELAVSSTTKDLLNGTTGDDYLSTRISSLDREGLKPERNEVNNGIIPEEATILNKVTEYAFYYYTKAISQVTKLPTLSPVNEMELVESITLVAPTLPSMTESEEPSTTESTKNEFYSLMTTDSSNPILEQTASNLFSEDSTTFNSGYTVTSTEFTPTSIGIHSTKGSQYIGKSPDISTYTPHTTYEDLTESFPESALPNIEVTEYSTRKEESTSKVTFYPVTESTEDRMTVGQEYKTTFPTTTEVPVYSTTVKMSPIFQETILPYFVATTDSPAKESTDGTTEENYLSTRILSLDREGLKPERNEVNNGIIPEDVTIPDKVTEYAIYYFTGATSPVAKLLSPSPVNEMEVVESSTLVTTTLPGMTEYEEPSTTESTKNEFYYLMTTDSSNPILEQTASDLFSEDSTTFNAEHISTSPEFTSTSIGTTTESQYIENSPDILTYTPRTTYGVHTESAESFSESTVSSFELPGYSTGKEESTSKITYPLTESTEDKTTVGQEYRTTFPTTSEVPVYATTVKMGPTFQETIVPYLGKTTVSLEQETMDLTAVQETSTIKETTPNTEGTENIPIEAFSGYSETIHPNTKEATGYPKEADDTTRVYEVEASTVWKTVPTTEVPVYVTTTENAKELVETVSPHVETVSPHVETTERYLTQATTQNDEYVATTVEETELSTDAHVSKTIVGTLYAPIEAISFSITTPRPSAESTLPEAVSSTVSSTEETSIILVNDETSASVSEKPTARQSDVSSNVSSDTSLWAITGKTKPYSKEKVRREDSRGKRRPDQQKPEFVEQNMTSDATDINTISGDLMDTARRYVASKPSLEGFETLFLKQLIPMIVQELRQQKVSKEDEASLKEVFGDIWDSIKNAALYRIPMVLSKTYDAKVAARALQYMLKGTPLARRMRKKSRNIGGYPRTKRESKTSRLEPWQAVVLQSLLEQQQSTDTSRNDDDTYRLVLSVIKDQLHAPQEDYGYDEEDGVGDTTEMNTSEKDDVSDSEYYDEDDMEY